MPECQLIFREKSIGIGTPVRQGVCHTPDDVCICRSVIEFKYSRYSAHSFLFRSLL